MKIKLIEGAKILMDPVSIALEVKSEDVSVKW